MSLSKALLPTLFFCVLMLTIFSYGIASSAELRFTSNTYLQLREDARDNKYAPLYEYFNLELNNLKDGQVSFYSSGWIRYDLSSRSGDERENDELTYIFLTYSPLKDRSLKFSAGRHFVFGGVASEQIDGISTRWEITPFTGFSLFGGIPVETESDGRGSDLIYGGRVFQRIERKAEFGVSYIREVNDGSSYREEMGLDVWGRPLRWFEIQGQSFYNNITEGWLDHSYNLRIFPLQQLTLSTLFSHTDYTDAFSATTLSAFSPDYLGLNEELTKIGGAAEYRLNNSFTGIVDYTKYEYKNTGNADYYGAKLTGKLHEVSIGASIHRMEGDTEKLKYTETRLYAMKRFSMLNLSVDAISLHYDTPYNGLSTAYSVNGTVGYKFSNSLMATVSCDYSKSPDFTHDTKVLLKLTYNLKRKV